jgi:orotidine-5'-phosphate decarboxylase
LSLISHLPTPAAARFLAARRQFGPLVFGVDPSPEVLSAWGLPDSPEGLERFVNTVISAAVGSVGVVKCQLAYFERHGWQGLRSLQRMISTARSAGLLVIADAKRGDIASTNQGYADAYLSTQSPLAADALTVSPYLGFGTLKPFFDAAIRFNRALFVVVRSSNSEGRQIQQARTAEGIAVEEHLLQALARENRNLGPGLGPFGAVFAATGPETTFDLASLSSFYLCPGIGAQGGSPAEVARTFASCPERVLVVAARSLLRHGPDSGTIYKAIQELQAELRHALGS